MTRFVHAAARITLLLVLSLQVQATIPVLSGARCFDCGQAQGGEFSHGDTVEITGTGFGSHALDFDFLGGDTGIMEANAVDATPSDTAVWTFDGTDQDVDAWALPVGFDDPDRGRIFRALYTTGTFDLAVGWDYGAGIPANTPVYISWWVRESTWTGPDPGVYQWKLCRLRATFGVADDPTNGDAYIANWPFDFGNSFVDFQGGSGGFENINGENSTAFDGSSLPYHGQGWHRMEWLVNTGSGASSVADSNIIVTREGVFNQRLVSTLNNFVFNRTMRHVIFQNYLGNATIGNGSRIATDDHYVQVGSFKRVELCASATLASCTWREIQRPTSWTDTAVEVELNTGAGRTGDLFLHVIGENGASLGSREVTISALFEGFAANDDLLVRAA